MGASSREKPVMFRRVNKGEKSFYGLSHAISGPRRAGALGFVPWTLPFRVRGQAQAPKMAH